MILWLLACEPRPEHRPGAEPALAPCPVVELPPARAWAPDSVPDLRLTGQWTLRIGWGVRLGNADGDRCDELLLGETRSTDLGYLVRPEYPRERVSVVDAPTLGGPIAEQRSAQIVSLTEATGAPEDLALESYGQFGYDLAVDPIDGSLLVGERSYTDGFDVASFRFGRPVQTTRAALGTLRGTTDLDTSLLNGALGVLSLPRGRFLWTATYQTIGDRALAGDVYLFDLPLVGAHDESDARAVYRADPGDFVQLGTDSSADLDGDGFRDLVVGAHARLDVGAVAVLSDPPDGDVRLWDVAIATVTGVGADQRLGDQVAAGDLDGDGIGDLLTGAAAVSGPSAFHGFRGPVAGDKLASDSDWTVVGEPGIERLGVSSATGDLDGDGDGELVIGRPGNPALGDQDGSVLIFAGPVPLGAYEAGDADLVVRNREPPGESDWFGYFLRVGNLDDNEALDLVIGAPDDRDANGNPAGSVSVLYGRPELFGP